VPETPDRLPRLSRWFALVNRVSELSGRATSWLVMPLILGVTYEVFARYALNAPTVWAYDLAYMLYAGIFMLGAAYALRYGAHVRTDFLYSGFSDRRKAVVDAVGYIVFLPALLFYLLALGRQAQHSWEIGERSTESAWRAPLYPFKWMMVVAMALLLLQAIVELLRTVARLRRNRPE
jgi:TRAP-type mannitol/chloroaromatic compound transport system permease small subunit